LDLQGENNRFVAQLRIFGLEPPQQILGLGIWPSEIAVRPYSKAVMSSPGRLGCYNSTVYSIFRCTLRYLAHRKSPLVTIGIVYDLLKSIKAHRER